MISFINAMKFDYLQRTRSYSFLITLCLSLAIAYSFVPSPEANYSTVRIGDLQAYYNATWIGCVTAVMTSIYLSLFGYYLINSSISNDIHSKVGQIIATTRFSNFKYLFSKVLSGFFVLLTITLMVIIMGVVLFYMYNEGFSLNVFDLLRPFIAIVIPAIFCTSVIAVTFETIFGRFTTLHNIAFFFVFTASLTATFSDDGRSNWDLFSGSIITSQLEQQSYDKSSTKEVHGMNIGYSSGHDPSDEKILYEDISIPFSFVTSRLLWAALGVIIIAFISPFFHRFDTRQNSKEKKKKTALISTSSNNNLATASLASIEPQNGILPFIKTELRLLFRQGNRWMWALNIVGWILLVVLPIETAHLLVIPILWFLQVTRLSNLTTKELIHNVHLFAYASYKPISRLFVSQLLAGIVLTLTLSLPLIIKLLFIAEFSAALSLVLGSVFIVLLAVLLGNLSKSKKLFEVIFFLLTYANINQIPFLDYFGAMEHTPLYPITLSMMVVVLVVVVFSHRKLEMSMM